MARPHPALIDIAAGRAAGSVGDDDAFVESALEHRMAGLALWASGEGLVAVGAGARQQLAALKLEAAAHAAQVEAAAATAVTTLRRVGWDAAIFKGIATEKRWYPETGTRPTADVDLFLSPETQRDLNAVVAALAPGHPLAGKAQALTDAGFIQSVDTVVDGVGVDLHVDPIKVGISLPGIERLWERQEKLKIGSLEVGGLDAEASLLQAAIHLQKDRFARLHGYADIARIAATPELDWDWIQSCAADLGLAVHLNETLRVVAGTLGIELPVARRHRSRLWRAIWSERTRLRGAVGMTRQVRTHYWIPFTIRGRRRDAFRSWWRVLFPPAEMVAYLHPETRGPYLWRLAQYRSRLAWERHRRNREQRRGAAL